MTEKAEEIYDLFSSIECLKDEVIIDDRSFDFPRKLNDNKAIGVQYIVIFREKVSIRFGVTIKNGIL